MATYEERTDSSGVRSYRVKVRLRGFPSQSATFARLTDAKRWAQKIETEIREGRYFGKSEAKKHTVSQLLSRYEKEVLLRNPHKYRNQKAQLDWWNSELGKFLLVDVTPAKIVQCREKLIAGALGSNGRSNATVNRYLALFSHVLATAVREWQWLDDNPMRRVKKLPEPRGRVRCLTEIERDALLTACRSSANQMLELIVTIALSTGMRRGEILGLKWNDVDLKRGILVIQDSKNGERRSVALVERAFSLFNSYSKVRRIDTDLVFSGKNGLEPIDIRSSWEASLVEAGIKNFRFHDLRHSAASYLAMNGATLAEIAEILGHKTLSMVKRYAHLCESHTNQVIARMNKQMFSESSNAAAETRNKS